MTPPLTEAVQMGVFLAVLALVLVVYAWPRRETRSAA